MTEGSYGSASSRLDGDLWEYLALDGAPEGLRWLPKISAGDFLAKLPDVSSWYVPRAVTRKVQPGIRALPGAALRLPSVSKIISLRCDLREVVLLSGLTDCCELLTFCTVERGFPSGSAPSVL